MRYFPEEPFNSISRDLISINWIKMSKGGPSRGAEEDWKGRQDNPARSAGSSLLEELLIRGRVRVKALKKKREVNAGTRARARNQEEKTIMREPERERVMQSFLAGPCWFTVTVALLYPYEAPFGFSWGPCCVPRGPRPSDDSLQSLRKKADKNSAACSDDFTDGICQLCHPVVTPRLHSLSLLGDCKSYREDIVHLVDLPSLQVLDNGFSSPAGNKDIFTF